MIGDIGIPSSGAPIYPGMVNADVFNAALEAARCPVRSISDRDVGAITLDPIRIVLDSLPHLKPDARIDGSENVPSPFRAESSSSRCVVGPSLAAPL